MNDFEQLVDLASARLGGAAIATNDDFFAEKENLVRDEAPVWIADKYTDRGKWMDGWESRRRRTPGHDWCVVRLGMPGVIRGVVVDTAFFKGNYPEACWLEGAALPHGTPEEHVLSDAVHWVPLLERTLLQGDHKNAFAIDVPWRFTHVKLHIDPDGGVARLRVHGEVVPEPWCGPGDAPAGAVPQVDLAALEHGGQVIAASDMFFGGRYHLTLPGASRGMHDGWETRRRRGPGHDWALVRLAARGTIDRVVIDTAHFKGNAPGTCTLEVADAPGVSSLDPSAYSWRPLLASTQLTPHTVHELAERHSLEMPDRRRTPSCGSTRRRRRAAAPVRPRRPGGRRALALARLDALVPEEASGSVSSLSRRDGVRRAVADGRPYGSEKALADAVDRTMGTLTEADWREAFAAHPKIGAMHGGSAWARDERRGRPRARGNARRAGPGQSGLREEVRLDLPDLRNRQERRRDACRPERAHAE